MIKEIQVFKDCVKERSVLYPKDFNFSNEWSFKSDSLNNLITYSDVTIQKPRANRHVNFYRGCARELTYIRYWNDYSRFFSEIYPSILNFAVAYKQSADSHVFKDYPSQNRFSDLYASRQRKRIALMGKVIKKMGYKNGLHITLTADPKNFVDIYSVYKTISKSMNILLTTLRRRYKNEFVYIRCYEVQTETTGMPHVHLLLLGKSWIDKSEIESVWRDVSDSGYGVQLDRVRQGEEVRDEIEYISKYIGKQFTKKEGAEKEIDMNLVIGWACNWKSISMSKYINKMIQSYASLGKTFLTNYSNTFLCVLGSFTQESQVISPSYALIRGNDYG